MARDPNKIYIPLAVTKELNDLLVLNAASNKRSRVQQIIWFIEEGIKRTTGSTSAPVQLGPIPKIPFARYTEDPSVNDKASEGYVGQHKNKRSKAG